MMNLSSNDLEGEPPYLDQVNLPLCRGISKRLAETMNLLKRYMPLVLGFYFRFLDVMRALWGVNLVEMSRCAC